MFEAGKSALRRLGDSQWAIKYFVGHGIDIGSGNDPLWQYQALYPLMSGCDEWDLQHGDGDAQFMAEVADATYDFVNSSHCLEHMVDVQEALRNWWRILKPGGHLILVVPEEDLYEQGVWPSTWNEDHKWSFTMWKPQSWCPKSLNFLPLLFDLPGNEIIYVRRLEQGFRPTTIQQDQTLTMVGECAIEAVIRKRKP